MAGVTTAQACPKHHHDHPQLTARLKVERSMMCYRTYPNARTLWQARRPGEKKGHAFRSCPARQPCPAPLSLTTANPIRNASPSSAASAQMSLTVRPGGRDCCSLSAFSMSFTQRVYKYLEQRTLNLTTSFDFLIFTAVNRGRDKLRVKRLHSDMLHAATC
eukprot:scaffold15464_cov140-Isochrysis_galbana.AAC.5